MLLKGIKREPKGAQRQLKVSQKATNMHPNIDLGTKVDIGEAIGPKRSSKGAKMDAQI